MQSRVAVKKVHGIDCVHFTVVICSSPLTKHSLYQGTYKLTWPRTVCGRQLTKYCVITRLTLFMH